MTKPQRPVAFILASTNHGSMLVNRHDYKLYANGTKGYGVGFQLLNTSSCEQGEIDIALMLLDARRKNYGDNVVAIDCGANIGTHTIEWAKHMYGWGKVFSFEAQERIYYALAGNITLNNCFNAKATLAAISSEKGVMRIPVPDYFTPSTFGSLELKQNPNNEFIGQAIDYSDEKTTPIQTIAIDDLQLTRLDFLKIDIEGMEMEALNGAKNSIANLKPILLIEKIKSSEDEIRIFLKNLGYKIVPVDINLIAIHETDPAASLIKES